MSSLDPLTQSANGDEPVFAEPWHAQVFAMAHSLSEAGLFTWKEWTACFSRHLSLHADKSADGGYYLAWLDALEEMVSSNRLITPAELKTRRKAWDDAAHRTPHGQPILLDN